MHMNMYHVLSVFDISGNGKIDFEDLKKVLTNLGEKFNDEDVEEMLKEADLNGDGMIDYEGERKYKFHLPKIHVRIFCWFCPTEFCTMLGMEMKK